MGIANRSELYRMTEEEWLLDFDTTVSADLADQCLELSEPH